MRAHIVKRKISSVIIIIIVVLVHFFFIPSGLASSGWYRQRPSSYSPYDETIGNEASNGVASIGMGVNIWEYVESPSGEDYIHLRVSASASTRGWISYDLCEYELGYNWYTVSNPTGINQDDYGVWLSLPFTVLFYGVEYNKVWVCDNGFLCFDSEYTNPNPEAIPNTNKPNSIIAPFWRNLNPTLGSQITYGRVDAEKTFLVISWNNVPNKGNGIPQSFQVLIEWRNGFGSEDVHNIILFSYKSITKDYTTVVGVENQIGNKGTSYSYNNLGNNLRLKIYRPNKGYRAERLTIRATKIDSYAHLDWIPTFIGGYNTELENYENPYGDIFGAALGIAAGLLLPEGLGIIFEITLIIPDLADVLSGNLSLPDFAAVNAGPSQNEANVNALCRDELHLAVQPLDCTLAAKLFWFFTDPNNRDHSLTITTELTYQCLDDYQYYTMSTSVTLGMGVGNRYLTVKTYTDTGYEITGVKVWIDGIQYYSPVNINLPYGSHTVEVESEFTRAGWLYGFEWWEDGSTDNPRIVNLISDKTIKAYYFWEPLQCPTLFVWNRSEYLYETLLNIHADSDITLQHQILQPLVKDGLFYKLQLKELDNYTSHIDQVKLYIVDFMGKAHTCILVSAVHNQRGNVWAILLLDDDIRIDLEPNQIIDLNFITVVDPNNIAYFIFEINGYNKKAEP